KSAGQAVVTGRHYEGAHWLGVSLFIWSRDEGFHANCRFRLTAPRFLLDDCDAWTLNASLTRSSSYRKCLKRRILGHSARATSRLRIDGMAKCLRIALGFGSGSGTEFAAVPEIEN